MIVSPVNPGLYNGEVITFSCPSTAKRPWWSQAQDVCVRLVDTTEHPRLVQPPVVWSLRIKTVKETIDNVKNLLYEDCYTENKMCFWTFSIRPKIAENPSSGGIKGDVPHFLSREIFWKFRKLLSYQVASYSTENQKSPTSRPQLHDASLWTISQNYILPFFLSVPFLFML